jgi:hypothetical protein
MLAEMKAPDRTESADSLAIWESRYKKQYIVWMCVRS